MRKAFIIGLVTILTIALFLSIANPATFLKLAGAIEAAHIPFVTALTLCPNHNLLLEKLRASTVCKIWCVKNGSIKTKVRNKSKDIISV